MSESISYTHTHIRVLSRTLSRMEVWLLCLISQVFLSLTTVVGAQSTGKCISSSLSFYLFSYLNTSLSVYSYLSVCLSNSLTSVFMCLSLSDLLPVCMTNLLSVCFYEVVCVSTTIYMTVSSYLPVCLSVCVSNPLSYSFLCV